MIKWFIDNNSYCHLDILHAREHRNRSIKLIVLRTNLQEKQKKKWMDFSLFLRRQNHTYYESVHWSHVSRGKNRTAAFSAVLTVKLFLTPGREPPAGYLELIHVLLNQVHIACTLGSHERVISSQQFE